MFIFLLYVSVYNSRCNINLQQERVDSFLYHTTQIHIIEDKKHETIERRRNKILLETKTKRTNSAESSQSNALLIKQLQPNYIRRTRDKLNDMNWLQWNRQSN